jgi:hypothetical protein
VTRQFVNVRALSQPCAGNADRQANELCSKNAAIPVDACLPLGLAVTAGVRARAPTSDVFQSSSELNQDIQGELSIMRAGF